MRAQLIRHLAAGEDSHRELAKRFDVSQQAISAFAKRHCVRIADVAVRIDDQFAALWAADKVNRIAEYQQQIEDIAALLEPQTADEIARSDAEFDKARHAGVNVSTAELMRVQAQALRAIADELGQIPARMQVEHSGSLQVQLNGVDVSAL